MKKLTSLFLLLLLNACSGGFQSSSGDGASNNGDIPFSSDLSAVIVTGPFEGQLVINNVRNSKIQILIPMGINNFLVPGPIADEDLDVTGRVLVDSNQSKLVELNIPYSYVLRGVSLPLRSQLPTGEALSNYFSNAVTSSQFPLDPSGQVQAHVYFSPPQFGVFIQSPFDQTNSRQYQVNYGTSFMDIGRFSTHPHLNGLNGGMFLFISLPQ